MYVCPDCKQPLQNLHCVVCNARFSENQDIADLLSRDPAFAHARGIAANYDQIYSHRSRVWEDQGRTPEFIKYFSDLVGPVDRLLEIGCGEGYLLAQFAASDKTAIDMSTEALIKASARSHARCSVALAERLPFPDEQFDAVVSVGVMEHFLDDAQATAEIRRVLKRNGRYLALIHLGTSVGGKIAQKMREFIYPRFRPIKLIRWLAGKVYRPISQPIQRGYTISSGGACLEKAGLHIERIINQASDPDAPFIGPRVVVYVARKN